ncbi:MAG: hypothetical protein AB1726_06335 [Planctomycetota bacterium]
MTMPLRRAIAGAALLLPAGACLAPPPAAAVETPFGTVRADTPESAAEFATLYERLVPRVRALLPGSQERPVELWVQEELMVYRDRPRPESVRGFTVLGSEFAARRIHIEDQGQSAWYLSHELVHAQIGEDWRPLPGILEEGLADVVAEELVPRDSDHIRAHRLLNASAFTGGLGILLAYSCPQTDVPAQSWERRVREVSIQPAAPIEPAVLRELLATPRGRLHRRWPEIPEPFYGIAWLIVSRIVERRGLDGLHQLCLLAERRGYELVPADWLLAAAELDLEHLDDAFLRSCLDPDDLPAVASLEPDLLAAEAARVLFPWEGQFSARGALRALQPAIRAGAEGGQELSFRFWPLRRSLYRCWRRGPEAGAEGGTR